jgi:HD-GYP domain-containing protein (c-di-GMP phosphodiesterase class II)
MHRFFTENKSCPEIIMFNTDTRLQIKRLTEIGIALSSELNLDILLEKIVKYARELTFADGGTLYLLQDEKLHFKILQNKSLNIFKGGKSGEKIDLAPVLLEKTNVSAFAAILGKTVRIDDVYKSEEFDFSGPRYYDSITGYRSKSMLVVPMMNHEGTLIGVLQMMNAQDLVTGEVIAFSDESLQMVESLASQAAVAISNANLIKETKDLFEGLIHVLALAIDAKSHSTRNHIQRVALFNVAIAKAINEKSEGPFKDIHFSEQELEEIRLSGWLHDVGKVTSPVWVVEKKHKLKTPFNRIEHIKTRFDLIRTIINKNCQDAEPENNKATREKQLKELEDDFQLLCKCNKSCEFMDDNTLHQLLKISQKTYITGDRSLPYLTNDELEHLTVRKGNLTSREISVMHDHIIWTKRMLAQIPFKGHLKNVPLYATQHHEKLNGKGYPDGLKAEEIPLQSRMLAVADVYEALSASDRPYKKPMKPEKVLEILDDAAKKHELDRNVVDLLIKDRIHEKFEKTLN